MQRDSEKISSQLIYIFSILAASALATAYFFSIIHSLFIQVNNLNGFGKADAMEYWSAFRIWISGGNPYSDIQMFTFQNKIRESTEPIMMWNPPWLLMIFSPILSINNFMSFSQFWFLFSLTAYLLGSLLLIQTFIPQHIFSLPLWITIATFPPALATFAIGQISAWLFLGLVLVLVGGNKNSAILLAIGCCLISLKPHLFISLTPLVFLCIYQSKANARLAAQVLIISLTFIAAIVAVDPYLFIAWGKVAAGLTIPTLVPSTLNWGTSTVPSVFSRLIGYKYNFFIWTIIITSTIWIFIVLRGYLSKLVKIPLSLLILTIYLPLSSFAWFFDYIVLLPAIIINWEVIMASQRKLFYFIAFEFFSLAFFTLYMTEYGQGIFIVAPLCLFLVACALKTSSRITQSK